MFWHPLPPLQLVESALCLVKEEGASPPRFGVVTPAYWCVKHAAALLFSHGDLSVDVDVYTSHAFTFFQHGQGTHQAAQ